MRCMASLLVVTVLPLTRHSGIRGVARRVQRMRVRMVRCGLVVVEPGGGTMAGRPPGLRHAALTVLMRRRHMWGESGRGWQQQAAILRRHVVMVVVLVDSSGTTGLCIILQYSGKITEHRGAQSNTQQHASARLSQKLRTYRATPSVLRLYFSQLLELIVALVFDHPDNFRTGMPTSSQ
jgi:hypothetical protein